jgi:hypothetical protein
MACSAQAGTFALQAGERPIGIKTFAGSVALAGLVNAAIAAFLLFRLPTSHAPSLRSLLIRAFIYVAGAVLAGMGGARFYWNRSSTPFRFDPPLSFRLFVLVNAAAWVWVPSIALLSRQDSPAAAALSALGAALLAKGLRRIIPSAAGPLHPQGPATNSEGRELFAETLRTAPREAHGYVIALCLYATGYFLINHFYLNAGAPLALAAFLFTWKLTLEPTPASAPTNTSTRAALRLTSFTTAAVLVTLFVLLYGIGHRNRVDAANVAIARGSGQGGDAGRTSRRPATVSVSGISGYESIILWPIPEKKQIAAPVPASISPFAARAVRPLVIRFDGPYWYFQPPGERPGPRAHQAQGNPIAVNIEANNLIPLTMEAIQNLSSPIRLSRCREIQVAVENRDNLRGPIALGLLLTDASAPGKPSLSLGLQPVLSSEPAQFTIKSVPADEVLRFPIPDRAKIRKFDEITVLFLPDVEHFEVGPRIAIQEFALLPR